MRNLHRSTTYVVRRRDRRGRRTIRRTDIVGPMSGRGWRARFRPDLARTLLWLALPGFVVLFVGLPRLLQPGRPCDSFYEIVLRVLACLFALRAYAASAPGWLRWFAVACCLAYPITLMLVW